MRLPCWKHHKDILFLLARVLAVAASGLSTDCCCVHLQRQPVAPGRHQMHQSQRRERPLPESTETDAERGNRCRRNGKPTSLGCFDHETEASRAYDKMMLWCELHNSTGVKGGITNFDPSEYEADIPCLQSITQVRRVLVWRDLACVAGMQIC